MMLNIAAGIAVTGVIAALIGLATNRPVLIIGGVAAVVAGYCIAVRTESSRR